MNRGRAASGELLTRSADKLLDGALTRAADENCFGRDRGRELTTGAAGSSRTRPRTGADGRRWAWTDSTGRGRPPTGARRQAKIHWQFRERWARQMSSPRPE
jgi:hypothetical protein